MTAQVGRLIEQWRVDDAAIRDGIKKAEASISAFELAQLASGLESCYISTDSPPEFVYRIRRGRVVRERK